jgi:inner membrane protein
MENPIASFWQKNRMIFKGLLIGLLVLILLIPTYMIQELVEERQDRQQEAITEVSSKWAGMQVVTGPVIVIPYWKTVTQANGTPGLVRQRAYFLPDMLNISSSVVPEKRYRGIYEVTVYTTDISITGNFAGFRFNELGISPESILWNEAVAYMDVSDVRGLKEEVMFKYNGRQSELVPGKFADEQFRESLSGLLPIDDSMKTQGASFNIRINLKGSQQLLFVPLGKKTTVQVESSWSNPSFTGNYLPDTRKVQDSGFSAVWQVLSLNRSYPQQWANRTYDLGNSAFGVELMVPVDAYQKSLRSVKYAILCIILTFTAFFLIELIYKKPLHALQYILVGFALCIFYTLLLSISEYIGFNPAYLVAAIATILLITWFVSAVLRSTKIAFFISILLAFLYGFIFILIQSQDYALLMGSIGLFVILGIVMYFSRRISQLAD